MSRRQVIFEYAVVTKRVTSRDIATQFDLPIRQACKEVLALRECGALTQCGMRGNARLYKVNPDKPPIGRGKVKKLKPGKVAVSVGVRRWRYMPIECLPLVTAR